MIIFLKGMVVGIANIIPGLSGGTMAVILGLYSRLIQSVSDILTFKLNKIKVNLLFLSLFFCHRTAQLSSMIIRYGTGTVTDR